MKTDKELAVEIVQAYIQSWHSVAGRHGMSEQSVQSLIQAVYTAIHELQD